MNQISDYVYDNKGKSAALFIAFLNLILGYRVNDVDGVFHMFIWNIFCLSFIWFGDHIGQMKVFFMVQKETPGIAMACLGWIMLFLPWLMICLRCVV